MNKDEILEKSRRENKNQDIYEKEVIKSSNNIGVVVAAILAAVFFIMQVLLGEGQNYGLYAILFSIPACNFVMKAIRLKRKHEIALAVFYVFATIAFSIAHIYELISISKVL